METCAKGRAEFPCCGSVRRIGLCPVALAAEVADLPQYREESIVATLLVFPYAFPVNGRSRQFFHFAAERFLRPFFLLAFVAADLCGGSVPHSNPPQKTSDSTPVVTKLEPPSWWIGLTHEVMLLLSGRDLEATRASCNLPTLHVSRTQAAAGGQYLFLSVKIGADTKPGTAVCPITAPKGTTAIAHPLSARPPQ